MLRQPLGKGCVPLEVLDFKGGVELGARKEVGLSRGGSKLEATDG